MHLHSKSIAADLTCLFRHPWAAVFALFPAVVILCVFAAAPLDHQACHSSTDDSFYYYSWARNLASGHGPTADGVTPTNGVQPLWAGILTMLATVIDNRDDFVKVTLFLCLLLNLAAGALWCRVAFEAGGPWLAWSTGILTSMTLVSAHWVVLSGMEISLNLFLGSLLILTCLHFRNRDWRRLRLEPLALGFLIGLFLLARVDNILYLIPVALVEIGLRLSGRRSLLPFIRLRDLPLLAIPVLLLTFPYVLWNKLTFGHWMPVSGLIKVWNANRHFTSEGMTTFSSLLSHGLASCWHFSAIPMRWISRAIHFSDVWLALGVAGPLVFLFLTVAVTKRDLRKPLVLLVIFGLFVVMPRNLIHGIRLSETALAYANWYRAVELLASLLLSGWVLAQLLQVDSSLAGDRNWAANPGPSMVMSSCLPPTISQYNVQR